MTDAELDNLRSPIPSTAYLHLRVVALQVAQRAAVVTDAELRAAALLLAVMGLSVIRDNQFQADALVDGLALQSARLTTTTDPLIRWATAKLTAAATWYAERLRLGISTASIRAGRLASWGIM